MPSDSEDEQEPTEEQRKERLAKLVPGLAPEEWGRKVQPAAQSDIDMASESEPSFKRGKGVVAGTEYGDSLLPPKMRPPIFAKQEFDGVVSDSSDEEDDLPAPGSLGRKIAEMKWSDGAPTSREARIEEIGNDEEGDDEDKADRARAKELKFDDDELDELMRQRVWGDGDGDEDDEDAADNDDMDIDMGDEQDDFLKFTREALGISDDMWDKIISSRRERGAYVPEPKTKGAAKAGPKVKSTTSAATMEVDEPKVSGKNMSLDSFETMMAAMEAELHRAREDKGGSSSAALPPAPKVQFKKPASAGKDKDASKKGKKSKKPKSKFSSLATLPSEADLDNMDDDDLAAMDAELRAALEEAGDMDDDLPEVGDLDEDLQRQYRMMRDLLESASQGQGGAASALLSRLGETMGNK
jgi:hypothetical protein